MEDITWSQFLWTFAWIFIVSMVSQSMSEHYAKTSISRKDKLLTAFVCSIFFTLPTLGIIPIQTGVEQYPG